MSKPEFNNFIYNLIQSVTKHKNPLLNKDLAFDIEYLCEMKFKKQLPAQMIYVIEPQKSTTMIFKEEHKELLEYKIKNDDGKNEYFIINFKYPLFHETYSHLAMPKDPDFGKEFIEY